MMKINDQVNFLKPYFLIMRKNPITSIYPINMQIECKFVVDFQCFHVENFQNKKYPQKQENLNNSNFL